MENKTKKEIFNFFHIIIIIFKKGRREKERKARQIDVGR
jgi:hypothetical protein